MPKKAIQFAKYLFAFGVLYWLWQSDKIDFSQLPKVLHPVYGPIILILVTASILIINFRLKVICHAQKLDLGFANLLRATLIGLFFNYALPGGAGGDIIKTMYLFKNKSNQRSLLVGTILIDRVIGVVAMIVMAFAAILLRPSLVNTQQDIQIIFFLLCGFIISFLLAWIFIGRKRKKYSNEDISFKLSRPLPILQKFYFLVLSLSDRRSLMNGFFLSLVAQSLAVMALYFIAVAIGYDNMNLNSFFIVVPLGFLTTAIPISPGGIGVGQMAFYALFKIYTGESSQLGPTIITVYQLLQFMMGLIGLYFYITSGLKPLRKSHPAPNRQPS